MSRCLVLLVFLLAASVAPVDAAVPGPGHRAPEVRAPGAPAAGAAAARPVPVKAGRYRGNFHTSEGRRLEKFTFRVTKNRRLTRMSAQLNVSCGYYPVTVETHAFAFPTVKINRRGRFVRTWRPDADSEIVLRGQLRGRRLVSGSLDYRAGVCVREAQLKARRIGR